MIPFVIKKKPENFQSMLGYLSDCEKGIEPPEDWIPESSTYWLLDGNEMIGVVNIRHRLTEPLLKAGGHIVLDLQKEIWDMPLKFSPLPWNKLSI